MRLKLSLISIFLWWAGINAQGQVQSYTMDYYANEAGLSQNSINCIFQDTLGYMWFGTQDGLNRFDGYSFTVYRSEEYDSVSLSDNYILGLAGDADGNIWIATRGGGLNKYEITSGRFFRYRHKPGDSTSLSYDRTRNVLVDNQGMVWVATRGGGLNRLDPAIGRFQRFKHRPADSTSLLSDDVFCLYQDKEGVLWVGTGRGLSKYNPGSDSFTNYKLGYVRAILEDDVGNFWVGVFGRGLIKLNRATGHTQVFAHQPGNPKSLSSNNIFTLLQPDASSLLVGTKGGYLNRLSLHDFTFTTLEVNHPNVRALYQDNAGNTWVGLRVGLHKMNASQRKFLYYRNSSVNTNLLTDNNTYAVYKDSFGNVWVASYNNGLARIDTKTGKIIHYTTTNAAVYGLYDNSIRALFEDSQHRFWVGTRNTGAYLFNRARNTFAPANLAVPGSVTPVSINQIYEDRQANIWFCTFSGLRKLDSNGKITSYTTANSKLSVNDTWSIAQDKEGLFYIGLYASGLDVFNPETNEFKHYDHNAENPASLANNGVSHVYPDKNNRIWVATYGGGLDRFHPDTQTFTHYSRAKGLSNPALYGILADKQGNLWMSHNAGISMFNPATETFTNYGAKDGLFAGEFNSGAYMQTPDGQMFFGGTQGVVSFYPDNFKPNPFVPPVHITRVSLFNKPLKAAPGTTLDSLPEYDNYLVLEPDQGYFSFDFVALNYTNPAANSYKYRLVGFDKDWIEAGTNRTAHYTNVPPGRYVFKVIAANNDGVWNTRGDQIAVLVKTPWWLTSTFRIFVLIAFILAVITTYKLRLRNIKKQKQLLERQIVARTSELADKTKELATKNKELIRLNQEKNELIAIVSHDLRSPLNQIKGLLNVITLTDTSIKPETKENMSLIDLSVERLRAMVTRVLDINAIESGVIELKNEHFDINAVIELVITNFKSLAADKNIRLVFNPSKQPVWVLLDKNYLIQILENLVSNALKFSQLNTTVTINCRQSKGRVEVQVADEGPGITEADKKQLFSQYKKLSARPTAGETSTGIGLSIVKKYVTAMNGKVWCENNPDKGTSFFVSFRAAPAS